MARNSGRHCSAPPPRRPRSPPPASSSCASSTGTSTRWGRNSTRPTCAISASGWESCCFRKRRVRPCRSRATRRWSSCMTARRPAGPGRPCRSTAGNRPRPPDCAAATRSTTCRLPSGARSGAFLPAWRCCWSSIRPRTCRARRRKAAVSPGCSATPMRRSLRCQARTRPGHACWTSSARAVMTPSTTPATPSSTRRHRLPAASCAPAGACSRAPTWPRWRPCRRWSASTPANRGGCARGRRSSGR